MEALARACGDLEELLRILTRDLSHEHDYLRVVSALRSAGEHARAVEWAEKGVAAFPDELRYEVRGFLIDHYQATGRHDEALAMEWRVFERSPELTTYERLRARAEKAGQLDRWRTRAIALLRARLVAGPGRPAARGRADPRPEWDRGTLAWVLLREGDVEGAWREAMAGPCDLGVRRDIAAQRAKNHPLDGIPVLQAAVEVALDRRDKAGYAEAVEILAEIRALFEAGRRPEGFGPYLAKVRLAHGAKRNFLAMLSRKAWGR
jgi:uncharacterized Zn finger protein